jgi:hypothetical protein
MRKTRKVTVNVPHDLYLQSRRLAAEYDTTLTAMVAYLLERLPRHLKNAGYPVGGPTRRVLGPADLARVEAREEAEKRARAAANAPKSAPSPHAPAQQNAESLHKAAISPTTSSESNTSVAPLDAITAAVRLYDRITNAESAT